MSRHAIVTALVAILLGASATVWAQDKTALEKSDAHFQEGARLYHAGAYDRAIMELKSGYALAPDPVFLVNIALAYAKLENWAEATSFSHRATIEPGLSPDAHAQTGGRAHAWQARLAVQALVEAAREPVEKVSVVQKPAEPAPQRARPGMLGWIGAATAGAGVLAIGGAVVVGATLQDERRSYEAAGAAGDAAEYERLRGIIRDRQSIGRVLLFSGAGLVVLGGGLILVDLLSADSVAIGPRGVTMTWAW